MNFVIAKHKIHSRTPWMRLKWIYQLGKALHDPSVNLNFGFTHEKENYPGQPFVGVVLLSMD